MNFEVNFPGGWTHVPAIFIDCDGQREECEVWCCRTKNGSDVVADSVTMPLSPVAAMLHPLICYEWALAREPAVIVYTLARILCSGPRRIAMAEYEESYRGPASGVPR